MTPDLQAEIRDHSLAIDSKPALTRRQMFQGGISGAGVGLAGVLIFQAGCSVLIWLHALDEFAVRLEFEQVAPEMIVFIASAGLVGAMTGFTFRRFASFGARIQSCGHILGSSTLAAVTAGIVLMPSRFDTRDKRPPFDFSDISGQVEFIFASAVVSGVFACILQRRAGEPKMQKWSLFDVLFIVWIVAIVNWATQYGSVERSQRGLVAAKWYQTDRALLLAVAVLIGVLIASTLPSLSAEQSSNSPNAEPHVARMLRTMLMSAILGVAIGFAVQANRLALHSRELLTADRPFGDTLEIIVAVAIGSTLFGAIIGCIANTGWFRRLWIVAQPSA